MSPPFSGHPSRLRAVMGGRRWIPRILILGPLLAGALAVAPSAAHADRYGYCQAASCNGLDPYYENCTFDAYTVASYSYAYSDGSRYEVDLRYSPDCEANWARVLTTTAQPFCVQNNFGNEAKYTSAPGLTSWTNMINGGPGTHDTAYLFLPRPTEELGQNVLWADDQPNSGEQFYYPC
jgi:hypothetical protein